MKPQYLRKRAATARREAAKLRAEAAAMLSTADLLERQAAEVEGFADIAEKQATKEVSHERKHSGTVNGMTEAHAMAISKSRLLKTKDPFAKAYTKAGFTQNSLAEKLGVSSASLTRYRNGRPIPKATADEIEVLTGWRTWKSVAS